MKKLFDIQERLIGQENHEQLKQSKVAVIGIGGLGCHVADGLIRLGIQTLKLIDDDEVSLSNLPRQKLFNEKDIGQKKVLAAKEKLKIWNRDIKIETHACRFTSKNGQELLRNMDVVIDCTDNYAARYAISKTTELANLPMIYGGVDKFEGQVGVFNVGNTKPFHTVFPSLESLLSIETCKASGVLPFVVGIVGNYQVAETYKIITGQGEPLKGMLSMNLLTGKQRILNIKS